MDAAVLVHGAGVMALSVVQGDGYVAQCDRCGMGVRPSRKTPRGAEWEMLRYQGWKRILMLGADEYGETRDRVWLLCQACVEELGKWTQEG